MNEKAKRVALYGRVSTDSQTVDNQIPALREYAERRGWIIVEEYTDEGISGAVRSRPALDKLLLDAGKRAFDIVLVAAFDRFARSTIHLLTALEEFRVLGVEFVSLRESVDTTTPMGRMVFTVCAAVAELERALIRERVHAGLRRARAQGKRLGRPEVIVSLANVQVLRREGKTLRQIGRTFGVSRTKILNVLKTAGTEALSRNPGESAVG